MKFTFHILLIALLVALAYASTPQKQIIVSYPKDTPNSVIEKSKAMIKEAGGFITHEYHLIKAFAASVPPKCMESIQTMSAEYSGVIEEDQVVGVADGSSR